MFELLQGDHKKVSQDTKKQNMFKTQLEVFLKLVMKTKVAIHHQEDDMTPKNVWFVTEWPQKKNTKKF